MARKKSASVIEEDETEVIAQTPPNQILPGISAPKNYTPYYVLLLIVFAFLLGALTTKIQYLQ